MKLANSSRIVEKYSNIKFHENPSSGSRVVLCGQTDGRTDRLDETKSHLSQFCGRAPQKMVQFYKILSFFGPIPPHVLCGLRGPLSWAWQERNPLLRLGRPWGAVTLPRWSSSGDRGGCSARRGLKPKFYLSTQTMVTVGIFPFKENSHGRAGNRTRELMRLVTKFEVNRPIYSSDQKSFFSLTSPQKIGNFPHLQQCYWIL